MTSRRAHATATLLVAAVTPATTHTATRVWPAEAIVGMQDVTLQSSCLVRGDVAAIHARPLAPGFPQQPEIVVSDDARVEGSLIASQVRLERGAAVTGTITAQGLECVSATACTYEILPALPVPADL